MASQVQPLRPRRALYYPFMSLKDPNWLKATALAFGQLQRMVPRGYTPAQDAPEVRLFENTEGPFGPLVVSAEIADQGVWKAQEQLHRTLECDIHEYSRRYSYSATVRNLGAQATLEFQIHREKLLGVLPDFLLENRLAWPVNGSRRREQWVAVHRDLGSAIMSTLASPVAEKNCLDVVTDDSFIHTTLVESGDQNPFDALLRKPILPSEDATSKLLHVVILSNFFDLRRMNADDISHLLMDHGSLNDIRNSMAGTLQKHQATRNPRELEEILTYAAEEATTEWIRSTRRLPNRIMAAAAKVGGSVAEIMKALAEKRPVKVLSEAAGLAIIVVDELRHIRGLRGGPYRYLSTIANSSGELAGGLFLPGWSQLAPPYGATNS